MQHVVSEVLVQVEPTFSADTAIPLRDRLGTLHDGEGTLSSSASDLPVSGELLHGAAVCALLADALALCCTSICRGPTMTILYAQLQLIRTLNGMHANSICRELHSHCLPLLQAIPCSDMHPLLDVQRR